MKTIVERVTHARVAVGENKVAEIQHGYLVLASFTHSDTEEAVEKMSQKILNLRIMADENDKMNKTINETGGSILAVSQFTLYADTSGRRPGFQDAAQPDHAQRLFRLFIEQLQTTSVPIKQGSFGEHMVIESTNDGPLTLILEI